MWKLYAPTQMALLFKRLLAGFKTPTAPYKNEERPDSEYRNPST
jgi:hypothetical protein